MPERLAQGTPTALLRAEGADLVAHYLDRPSPTSGAWACLVRAPREEQLSHCRRFATPAIGAMAVGDLTRADFQRILDAAPTDAMATNLCRYLSALVAAAMDEGLLLSRQDVLRGVRRRRPIGEVPVLERTRHLEPADIPNATAVHALARAAAETTGVWWRELQILLVAYSGLRWGEHAALTADRLDPARRRITADRRLIETRRELNLAPPKNRRRRMTMYPAGGGPGPSIPFGTSSPPGPSPSRARGPKTSPACWATRAFGRNPILHGDIPPRPEPLPKFLNDQDAAKLMAAARPTGSRATGW